MLLIYFIYNCSYIGFGVFTKKDILKGEFILEYSGKSVTLDEGRKLLEKSNGRCFVYNYKHKEHHYW